MEEIEKFFTNHRLSSDIDDTHSFRKKANSLRKMDSLHV